MTTQQIEQIIQQKALPETCDRVELIETHISWVLLAKQYVYKIKKPLQLSFLDFSSLDKRKFYCEKELELNRRLAPDIYLDLLPIEEVNGQVRIVKESDNPVDYCVRMVKMNPERHLALLLQKGQVSRGNIKALAEIIAQFHQEVAIVKDRISPQKIQEDFADIIHYEHLIFTYLGEKALNVVHTVVAEAETFTQNHQERIRWRDQHGYTRDCHGDLHAGNIFMLEKPIVFDCIEFNEDFRQIDILNELAFFCMDLDFYDYPDLSRLFLTNYFHHHHCPFTAEDVRIFNFYKLYRANVKLKVNLIKCGEANSNSEFERRLRLAKSYYRLLLRYRKQLAKQVQQ